MMGEDKPPGNDRTIVWLGGEPQREHLPASIRALPESEQAKGLEAWRTAHRQIVAAMRDENAFASASKDQLLGALAVVVRGAQTNGEDYIVLSQEAVDNEVVAVAMETLVVDKIHYPTAQDPVFIWIHEERRIVVERAGARKDISMPIPAEFYLIRAQSVIDVLKTAQRSAVAVDLPVIGSVLRLAL